MIHLRVRTEYSFRQAYGKIASVLDVLERHFAPGEPRLAAITDGGTWGWVAWAKACKARGLTPVFGVTLATVQDARSRERQPAGLATLLARNATGARALYGLVTLANREGFYYYPRVSYSWINELPVDDVTVLMGHGTDIRHLDRQDNTYLAMCPTNAAWNRVASRQDKWPTTVVSDNRFPTVGDQSAYEVLSFRDKQVRATAMHLLSEDELRLAVPMAGDEEFQAASDIAADIAAFSLPKAENIHVESERTLRELCLIGAVARAWPDPFSTLEQPQQLLSNPVYAARLDRELEMISAKQFESYFFMLTDMVAWAKQNMLVGPARGSSAGSLVCYLLGITDVDPIKHDLMFERFIDVTRADLPDVDIDFQDDRRDMVIQYLGEKYGHDRVARIGTVAKLKAKSALGDVGQAVGIPAWELKPVQDAVIERSTGDARAQFSVRDALDTMEIGKALLAKYPMLSVAAQLEGHAQHTGKHAAGVVVAQQPITNYCSIDQSGAVQLDKKDAEALNMLKIDALGLRTLSVLQDCLDQIGKDRHWLIDYPLDDPLAFKILNDERFSGIFQFEGYALQSLCRQMKVENFDDLAVLGALARPGPLHCGATTQFIMRRNGQEPVHYMHPLAEPITKETFGLVIYQEQVMAMSRTLGMLSWEDVSELRKAMSKSLGEEFFNRYWEKFRDGTRNHGIDDVESRGIWEQMCTFGSWAFNKSHSVSYGIISYWCCMLKARWPLEFAAACLRNEKNEDQGVSVLRDLKRGGFDYTPVDAEKSTLGWEVVDGRLIGGLTNIKGVGPKKAADIIARRSSGKPLLPGQLKLLANPKTPYDDLFEGERRFGDIYAHPEQYNVISGVVSHLNQVGPPGEYVVLAKLAEKNLRDLNEYGNVVKRGGRIIDRDPLFLNMMLEDDTSTIIARISRWDYQRWGRPLVEAAKTGEWFMWKGRIMEDGFRLLQIARWRCLEESSTLYTPFGPSAGEASNVG